ncbi:PH domain-containing protein [Bifidobacterium pseudolongum]|uniref:PH domain-containing protein n=1 Tax=Bifidobacterium pseudolongum TaxID=1694 RepID=UPI001F10649D|nr:PH domain-containing protein [Bifidobacterium pseudolongum]MCH4853557.1 PH domain-containing protein [Bifidobacterium pseudolongum]
MGLFNALAGNLQQVSNEQLMQQYGPFLFTGEQITNGYQLVRDAVAFTNLRIIFVDKQGATGAKARFKTIHLDSIVDVEVETAGAIADDSEINITYLKDVYQRKTGSESFGEVKLEFPPQVRYRPDLPLPGRAGAGEPPPYQRVADMLRSHAVPVRRTPSSTNQTCVVSVPAKTRHREEHTVTEPIRFGEWAAMTEIMH